MNHIDTLLKKAAPLKPIRPERAKKSFTNNSNHVNDRKHLLSLSCEQNGGDRIGWEYHNVTLSRVPGYGFGIAVSGGRDNPHFMHGDPSIAISDVLKAGPAENKLQVNDRVVTANGISLENVDYSTAVQVLRECGASVNLLIKRRVLLPPPSDVVKVSLSKNKKKDDFGIVLGCRLYIKEITNRNVIEKDSSLQEGDIVLKINNASVENLSVKEAKKLMDGSKDKLNLVIKRENCSNNNRFTDSRYNQLIYENGLGSNIVKEATLPFTDGSNNRQMWSNQNVYVQPPTRAGSNGQTMQPPPPPPTATVDEINSKIGTSNRSVTMNARSNHRGPVIQNEQKHPLTMDQGTPTTPLEPVQGISRVGVADQIDGDLPPRPPPPRPEVYGIPESSDPFKSPSRSRGVKTHLVPSLDARIISFQKDGSVGIRLTGGNETGIFVASVQPGSPAALQGLQPGDRILKVNLTEIRDMTREDAVLLLLSAQDKVDLIVQYQKDEYEKILTQQKGDSFYIKTHFDFTSTAKGELSFHANEVFHVTDTLFNGTVGSWQVYRLGRNNQEVQKGTIPNRSRAEQLASDQAAEKAKKAESSEYRGSFFKRRSARRSKSFSRERSESLSREHELTVTKFPPYETVSSKHPGFIRPVVIFGPLADIARDKLLREYPDKYSSPQTESTDDETSLPKSSPSSCKSHGIFRLSSIREIIEKGRHALLDVTPSAIDRLNYAAFYPIVIFMRAENKTIIKELRNRHSKENTRPKSSRKLLEQNIKLEKHWPHIFTSTIALTQADMWYKKLRETIEKQQQQSIWLPESKPSENISDDFLFPTFLNTSRLSYASSPESDIEIDRTLDEDTKPGADSLETPRLVKASSDPSLAVPEEATTLYAARTHRQLPLHMILRKELSRALRRSDSKSEKVAPPVQPSLDKNEKADHEEYFGTTSPKEVGHVFPTSHSEKMKELEVEDNYANTGRNVNGSGRKSNPTKVGPEPPPRVDRGKKPSRFRSAHERLFGRFSGPKNEPMSRESYDAPDYINTATITATVTKTEKALNGKTGLSYIDNSSLSSDSYNKYTSPQSTLDGKHRNGLTSTGLTNSIGGGASRPTHDPYRFTKISSSGCQPGTPTKSNGTSLERKPSSAFSSSVKQSSAFSSSVKSFPADAMISSPLKPANYQSVYVTGSTITNTTDLNVGRLTDGRPVPPPKPSNYSSSSRRDSSDEIVGYGQTSKDSYGQTLTDSYGQTSKDSYGQTPKDSYGQTKAVTPLSTLYGPPSKRASSSKVDGLTGGPPGYFQTTKESPRGSKVPPPSIQELAYSTHSTFSSRRPLFNDNDSGYMTGKSSSHDARSQYSMKTSSSSRNSSGNNVNGNYLNLPMPPRSRNSTGLSGAGMNGGSYSHHHQSPSYSKIGGTTMNGHSTFHPLPPPTCSNNNNMIDLSMNREGSAFEVYKKPEDSLRSSLSFTFNGLPPPPPPPLPPPLLLNDSKRLSTVSNDSSHNVVAVAKGKFTRNGGILKSQETGVSIVVPEGALDGDEEQEIYFKVCQDTSLLPELDETKGEKLLSPIVLCGPRGLQFQAPVELRIPHLASNNPDDWTFALKSSDTSEGGKAGEWQNVTSGNDGISASKIDPDFVSVFVDHF